MANTHGFEAVAEASTEFIEAILIESWKSGGWKPGEPVPHGVIPEYFDVPVGDIAFGPLELKDGHVHVISNQIDIRTVPERNSLLLNLGIKAQAHLERGAEPPVPSRDLITASALVSVTALVGNVEGPTYGPLDVGLILRNLPREDVVVKLDRNPIAANLDQLLADFVHASFRDGTIPQSAGQRDRTITFKGINAYIANEHLTVFDDPNDPTRRIEITHHRGTIPETVRISLPLTFSLTSIRKLDPLAPTLAPLVCSARLVITAPLLLPGPGNPDAYTVALGSPDTKISVEALGPAFPPAPDTYTSNKARLGADLDAMLAAELTRWGRSLLDQISISSKFAVTVPSATDIEQSLGDAIHKELVSYGDIALWQPESSPGSSLEIKDVEIKVLGGVLALAINPGMGADPGALEVFMPPGRNVAFALSAVLLNHLFTEAIEEEIGPLPHRFAGEKDVVLKSLKPSLRTGALHFDGEVTVIDAFLGFDVDASFEVDVGLSWDIGPDGEPALKPNVGDPVVRPRLSAAAALVIFFLGVLVFGPLGGIVANVVLALVWITAARIGGGVVRNPEFPTVFAWPKELTRIGEVEARFDNPIEITPDGIVFSG